MNLPSYLLLAGALFSIGVYGLVTRRNAIGLLISIELMANAVNINFVAFARFRADHVGQVFALFTVALTVAEVVIGLALVILLYRARKDILVDLAGAMRG